MDINDIFLRLLEKVSCKCVICRNQENTPREIAFHNYCALNSEGQFNDYNQHVFDWNESQFADFASTDQISFFTIRDNYCNYKTWNIPFGVVGCHGVKNLYRKCPIQWSELHYLQVALPRRPGGQGVTYNEHSIRALIMDTDIVDTMRYNLVMTRNVKFSFLIRNLEMQEKIIGVFKNPFVTDQRSNWSTNWQFIETSASPLVEWVRILNHQSNSHVVRYFAYYKIAMYNYSKDLKLDDPRFWAQERREGEYQEHLRMMVKMQTMAFNLAYHAMAVLWQHLARTQMDLARLVDTVLKK